MAYEFSKYNASIIVGFNSHTISFLKVASGKVQCERGHASINDGRSRVPVKRRRTSAGQELHNTPGATSA